MERGVTDGKQAEAALFYKHLTLKKRHHFAFHVLYNIISWRLHVMVVSNVLSVQYAFCVHTVLNIPQNTISLFVIQNT